MIVIRKFFSEFDMFSAPATLRIKQQPDVKTPLIGVISFAIGCLFLYIFISNTIDLMQFNSITYTQTETSVGNEEAIGNLSMFALSLNFMKYKEFDTMFQFRIWFFQDGSSTLIPVKKCVADDWTDLGDNYTSIFQDYRIGQMYCPDITSQIELKKTVLAKNQNLVQIQIWQCSDSDPTLCNQNDATKKLQQYVSTFGNSVVWVYILDKVIDKSDREVVKYYVNVDTRAVITDTSGTYITVQFSSYSVQTDISILPWISNEDRSGIKVSKFQQWPRQIKSVTTDSLSIIRFIMNDRKVVVSQTIGKIDNTFSYVGGLFSIVISFMAIFLSNYNKYKYELTVAQRVFSHNEKGEKYNEKQFNFLYYIQYTLFDWIGNFRQKKPQWKECLLIDQTRKQALAQMDTDILLRRLYNAQSAIDQLISADECLCLNILSLPNLQTVKSRNFLMTYYDEILTGRCSLTMKELKQMLTKSEVERVENRQKTRRITSSDVDSSLIDSYSGRKKKSILTKRNGVDLNQAHSIFQELNEILIQFPEIKYEADNIKINADFFIAEAALADSFMKLQISLKRRMALKIPVLILCRLQKNLSEEKDKQNMDKNLTVIAVEDIAQR